MNPIVQAITDALGSFFSQLLNNLLNGLFTALGPIEMLIGNTPLNYATGNPVVMGAWTTMTAIADSFLGLYVIVKLIQMMHGEATGTTHLPIGQFVPRVILTVILIHASAFLGQELLLLVNALCDIVLANVQNFIMQINNGQLFNTGQTIGFGAVLGIVFGINLWRLVFQAVKRIVLFDVLFVFSGPAFLMSLDMQTAPWFQFWLRLYLITIFTQFFQFLTFGLGIQFLTATKQTGFPGFVLAVAMLNITVEIPGILSRFSGSSGGGTQGLEGLISGAMTAASLFL